MNKRARSVPKFSLFSFQDIITSVTGIMLFIVLMMTLDLLEQKQGSPTTRTETLIAESRELLERIEQQVAEQRQQLAVDASGLEKWAGRDISEVKALLEKRESENRKLRLELDAARRMSKEIQATQSEESEKGVETESLQKRLAEILKEQEALTARLKRLQQSNRVVYRASRTRGRRAWLIEISGGELLAAEVGVKRPPQRFRSAEECLDWAKSRNSLTEFFTLLVKPDGITAYELLEDELQKAGFERGIEALASEQSAIDPEIGAGEP